MKNKKLLLFISLFFSTLFMYAQIPQRIDFQAMARDGSGNPIINQIIGVQITVKEGATTVYTERHTPLTDDYGLFTLAIGEGTPVSGSFAAINWSLGNQRVKVEVDPDGGTTYVYMGTSDLASVPFAFYGEDDDADPANELQTLSLSGNDLSISDGNTVTLPGGGSSLWTANGNDIYYNDGAVGIGTDSPDGSLHVQFNDGNTTTVFGDNFSTWAYGPNISIGKSDEASVLYVGQSVSNKGFFSWNYDPTPEDAYLGLGVYDASNPLVLQPVGNNTGVGVIPLVKFHVAETGSDGVSGSDLGISFYPGSDHAPAVFASSVDNNIDRTYGLMGMVSQSGSINYGVFGDGEGGSSSFGTGGAAYGGTNWNIGIYGKSGTSATNNYAGYFVGDVHISGTLSKSGGSFKIDHPQDPANKYLIHSFVESPDMMNIYNGNVVTDAEGLAVVELPSYFEAENMDFKYQLTVIGQFAQAIIKNEISNNRFTIQTDKPNVKVSWQVTGVRNDSWANAHRIVPEVEKTGYEKGRYLHPELFGKSKDMGISPANLPSDMKQSKPTKPANTLSEPKGPMGIRK